MPRAIAVFDGCGQFGGSKARSHNGAFQYIQM